jgi:hypothetical protein
MAYMGFVLDLTAIYGGFSAKKSGTFTIDQAFSPATLLYQTLCLSKKSVE